ncbi:hypothetical protein Zmor_024208 [Zophobas morio]|uniref:Uncharacterized protein n=1 Tax=Zophobas morio TaxID=2755281 RepID=A0AA38M851_9CUCU|nr:hypothetical protein Zmor_024208 [Zophobas morio]
MDLINDSALLRAAANRALRYASSGRGRCCPTARIRERSELRHVSFSMLPPIRAGNNMNMSNLGTTKGRYSNRNGKDCTVYMHSTIWQRRFLTVYLTHPKLILLMT